MRGYAHAQAPDAVHGGLYLETMPLVIVSGLPCSGKTRRVTQLVEHVHSHYPEKQVQVLTSRTVLVGLWLV